MLEFLSEVVGEIALATANLGANTMSAFLSYEPEMPECLAEKSE